MTILILLILLIPAIVSSATVSLDSVDQRANKQMVFFIVNHDSIDYQYHAAISPSVDPTAHIQSQADTYMAQIYREIYRKAPHDLNTITQWEAWIIDGALDNKGKVVKRKPFTGRHPKSIKLKADIDESTLSSNLKDLLKRMLD